MLNIYLLVPPCLVIQLYRPYSKNVYHSFILSYFPLESNEFNVYWCFQFIANVNSTLRFQNARNMAYPSVYFLGNLILFFL